MGDRPAGIGTSFGGPEEARAEADAGRIAGLVTGRVVGLPQVRVPREGERVHSVRRLTTLLSHSGMPLIIDQPEEDLESGTVLQIVAKIWQSKSGRQLIFSSHNANLVVNGDADLVLVCAYVNAGDQSA